MLAVRTREARRREQAASLAGSARRAATKTRVLGLTLASTAMLVLSFGFLVTIDLGLLLLALAIGVVAWLQLRSVSLERELRQARIRALDAMDRERQRIERDLHDSVQQRLVSVRIHLGLLAQEVDRAPERDVIDRLGRDLDAALSDIRNVTVDSSPRLLLRNGVTEALRAVAAHAPLNVVVEATSFSRYSPAVERAIYFFCLEALQNVIKHAGPRAVARIRLFGEPARLRFTVEDSGVGFEPARTRPGVGLVSLNDRVAALGGHLTLDSRPGFGTRVVGELPLSAHEMQTAA
jgi:signal transduction histidine kinase